jgi:CRP-like cAMP-binding protein
MLGAEHKRPSTIRALTACFTLEVPRASFIAAMARHPGEKHHFERFAVQVMQEGGSAGDETVQWPFLKGAPGRMLYLLNLYAGLKAIRAGEVIAQAREGEVMSSSVLIAHGEAVVLDSEGNEVLTLQQGECYNERAILGVPPDRQRVGESIVARAHCEAQVITDEVWKRVSSEFPEEQEPIRQQVIRHMASQAIALQEQMLTALAQHLEPRLVPPMQDITSFGDAASHLLILVEGRARCECSCGAFEYTAGKVFNEAVLLGVVHYSTRTVSAHTLCVLQALDRVHFQDQSSWTQNDLQIMEPLLDEARECADLDLEACLPSTRLGKMAGFDSAAHEFLVQICDNADDRFFVPGEVIMQHGERCEPGLTPFFALFRGDLVLENDLGVHLGHVKPGETFGESGALGLADMRTVTVRASMSGCVHVLRIEGVPFTTGIRMFPHECHALEAIIDARWGNTTEQAGIRQKWIRDKVVPALRAHWMFVDTSLEFVGEVAVGLSGSDVGAGDVIAEAGSPADSMLILLEGEADVETEGGVKLGSLKAGASIGEVALMGIFPMRLATLRATTACSVLPVTEKALRRALAELGMQGGSALTELTAHRSWQVQQGLPLTALPMRLNKDNICVRSIALQARRIHLAPNQIWECLPASHPAGQHFSILASGRANVELCNEEEPPKRLRVQTLNPGSLIVEDVAAEYGMWVRALSVCEGYRVRMVDFKTATAKSPAAADEWYPHFRLIQVEAEEKLRSRGDNVRGQMVSSFEHPNSDGIRLWKNRRERAMTRAPKQVLPPLVHADSQQELRPRPLKPLKRELSGSALPMLPGI